MSDPTNHTSPTDATSTGWRITRWLLVIVAALITLVLLVYAFVDWRGKRAWDAYQRQWAAKGGLRDFNAFIPAPVPDDENFAMTPFLAPLFDFNPLPLQPGQSQWRDTNGHERAASEFARASTAGYSAQAPNLWRQGRGTDLPECLKAWRDYKKPHKAATNDEASAAPLDRKGAATAILAGLEQYRPVLDELRQASHRPRARFNIRYDQPDPWGILLPHIAVLKGACVALQVRASAELATGNAQAAAEDVALMFHLSGSIKDEPFVITHLVRLVMINYAVQAIWEGLASRQWTEEQLRSFQSELGELNVLRDLQRPLDSERAADNLTFELLRNHHDRAQLFSEITGAGDPGTPLFLLVPRGWSYQEQVVCNQLFDRLITPGFDPGANQVRPTVIDSNSAALNLEFQTTPLRLAWNHLVMARLLLPALGKTFQKSAVAQSAVDEANMACALERYRIAKGRYPDAIEALWPDFIKSLPHDVCTGQPLKYRLGQNGQYVLYSVGWNEKDDGGVVALKGRIPAPGQNLRPVISEDSNSAKPGTWDPNQGDWVWQYPSNEP